MEKLYYTQPAASSDQALPLGNGRIGAMLYSGVTEDVYTLNDDTLWSGYPRDRSNPVSSSYLDEIRRLVSEGKYVKAQDLAEERMYSNWSQSYLPAGALKITTGHKEFTEYKRTLYLDNAVHKVSYRTDGSAFTREAFISNPDDVLCIRYCGTSPLSLKIAFECKLKSEVTSNGNRLCITGEAPGDCVPLTVKAKVRARYSTISALRGMTYTVLADVKSTGGAVNADGDTIYVKDAETVEIRLTIKTSFAGYDKHPFLEGIEHRLLCEKTLDKASDFAFDTLMAKHISDYKSLYDRLSFELDGTECNEPTDKRLSEHTNNKNDLSFYALMYQYGRYLLISCSRRGTQPANLQGIWNEDPAPIWSSNYTSNINIQMNYWGAEGANLAECCEPLHQMLYELKEAGTQTAKEHYDAKGFCVHHNIDLWRVTQPMGAWNRNTTRWAYFPLGGAWLTRHLFEYYSYTLDKDFLAGQAYDVIKASAEFCDSMLTRDTDGKLIFSPATSPENTFVTDGKKCSMSKSSAMFQSIVRDAFEIFIKSATILERDTGYAQYIKTRLSETSWLEIGSDGQILEWNEEFEETDVNHRHLSHLYSLYPAKMITDERLKKACRRSLELRGDNGTGWSCAWKICFWAMLCDGNRALELLDRQLVPMHSTGVSFDGGGTYPNLLNAHPPFQIDGSLGLLAGVNEMLARNENGKVILLPALPDRWQSGSVRGLNVTGGFTVDMEWSGGVLKHTNIVSANGTAPEIIYNGKEWRNND